MRNVTNDQFGDYAPTWTPDGKAIIYLARVSGNDKLFRLDLASGTKTQLTFGTHDDGGAQFSTTRRSCSRQPRSIRISRWIRKWRVTETSSISGRST